MDLGTAYLDYYWIMKVILFLILFKSIHTLIRVKQDQLYQVMALTILLYGQANEQDGYANGVYGQMFDNEGTKIGLEFQINTYTTLSQTCPCIASDGNNYFVCLAKHTARWLLKYMEKYLITKVILFMKSLELIRLQILIKLFSQYSI